MEKNTDAANNAERKRRRRRTNSSASSKSTRPINDDSIPRIRLSRLRPRNNRGRSN